ncbi:MAG: hypothetical protein DYH13_03400 [Alphaproteobacteria bacterium PRO2]|nr:hypothetical protein [Alphaproteobacteria bacterium PRO2]
MAEKSVLEDIFFHAAVLIPLEFGLLHATPLGHIITSGFENLFTAAGFMAGAEHLHEHPAFD